VEGDERPKPPYFGAPGFSDSYWIELLFNQPPSLDPDALIGKLGNPYEIAVKMQNPGNGTVTVANREHPVPMEVDGTTKKVPTLTNVVWSDARIDIKEYKAPLEQTWEWDGARRALSRCWYRMLVGDLTGSRLPYRDRFQILTDIAVACAELTNPLVCHWKEAGCLVEPSVLAEHLARVCNVRQFEVGIAGDHLMDTLGLAALGLPDIELYFRGLDPGMVAGFLYATARYMFDRGDVINDGDTVPSPDPQVHWKTAHDVASVRPARTVVKVIPDPRYAGSAPR
jgi:Domain of unknown function (DUF4261)